jgi:hypothetical protein
VTVRQVVDERCREYLMRVAKLSREVGFINSVEPTERAAQEGIRTRFAMTLAINGLRGSGMRRTLMQTPDLNWSRLTNSLRNSEQARKDDIVLCRRGYSPKMYVKREPFHTGYGEVQAVSGGDVLEPEWRRKQLSRTRKEKSASPGGGDRGGTTPLVVTVRVTEEMVGMIRLGIGASLRLEAMEETVGVTLLVTGMMMVGNGIVQVVRVGIGMTHLTLEGL